jgi:hypothetical protein
MVNKGFTHGASVNTIPPLLHTHLFYMLLLPERQTGGTWELSKKQCSFGNRGALDRKVATFSFSI